MTARYAKLMRRPSCRMPAATLTRAIRYWYDCVGTADKMTRRAIIGKDIALAPGYYARRYRWKPRLSGASAIPEHFSTFRQQGLLKRRPSFVRIAGASRRWSAFWRVGHDHCSLIKGELLATSGFDAMTARCACTRSRRNMPLSLLISPGHC